MREERRTRAMRLVLSALLKSDLSISEMQELIRDLSVDPRFFSSLSLLLSGHANPGKESASIASPRPRAAIARNMANHFMKHRKTARGELLDAISAISSEIRSEINASKSTREILLRYFELASDDETSKLFRWAGLNIEEDPYVRGIREKV